MSTEFNSEFRSFARQYVEEGRYLFFPGRKRQISDKDLIPTFFNDLAHRYELDRRIPESVVRLDQEAAIAFDLQAGRPVLLRAFWKTGQTNMVRSLMKRFDPDSSVAVIFGDTARDYTLETASSFRGERGMPFNKFCKQFFSQDRKVFIAIEEMLMIDDLALRFIHSLRDVPNVMILANPQFHTAFESQWTTFFADFQSHYLRPLTEEEVGLLVRKPLEDTPVTISDEAVHEIADFCGGWPRMVHGFCQSILGEGRSDGGPDLRTLKLRYEKEDIQAITSRDLSELYSTKCGDTLSGFFRVYREAISSHERAALDKIAVACRLPVQNIDPETIPLLVKSGLVLIGEDDQSYYINGRFFQRAIATGDIKQ